MDKDRIAGSAKVIKGTIKDAIGKATGDAKLETEGKADKVEGKVQKAPGWPTSSSSISAGAYGTARWSEHSISLATP